MGCWHSALARPKSRELRPPYVEAARQTPQRTVEFIADFDDKVVPSLPKAILFQEANPANPLELVYRRL